VDEQGRWQELPAFLVSVVFGEQAEQIVDFMQLNRSISTQFTLLILLFLFPLLIPPSVQAAKLRIDISSPYVRKIPVSLVGIVPATQAQDEAKAASRIITRLAKDLLFHGFFTVISFDTGIPGKTPDYKVVGQVRNTPSGLVVELRLMDMASGAMLTGRRYVADYQDLDRVCHRFCDEMIRAITGEPGVSLSRILFVSRNGSGQEIYSARFDGTDIVQETDLRTIVMSPRYSPDGRYIAFLSFRTGKPALYLKDLTTGRIRRLASYSGLNMSPAWAPDSQRVCVTLSKDGNPDLYLMDLNGRILKRLTRGPGINVSPSFSPDGKNVVFVSDRSGSPQLYIMDLATLKARRITYSGNYNTDPQWSPKGDRIVYTGRVNGRFQIFTISVHGGTPEQLTDSGSNENPTWSPDGRQILFSSSRGGGDKHLYVMFADGQGERRILKYGTSDYFPFWGPNLFR